jgi:hypothetical protein
MAMKMRRPGGGGKKGASADLKRILNMSMKSSSRTFSQGLAVVTVLQGGNSKEMHKAMLRLKINPNKDLTSIHSETQINPVRVSMSNFMAKMYIST